MPRRTEQKDNTGLIIGLIAGGAFLFLLCCGGGGFFVYSVNQRIAEEQEAFIDMGGFDEFDEVMAEEVQADLAGNSILADQIGTVSSFTMDNDRTEDDFDMNTFVYRVEGSKANGYVTAESLTNDVGVEEVESALLELDNGQTFQLIPEHPLIIP